MGNKCCTVLKDEIGSLNLTDIRNTAAILIKYYDQYDSLRKEDKMRYDEALIRILVDAQNNKSTQSQV